ncbi:MAG: glycosyltransferase family 9 protein [Candidatus Omnitrophica bacterium]|nr:glycosyltransferase family 9 protein [Candidatus Omnitrophota bacterium]
MNPALIESRDPSRILITRTDRMGDLLLSTPVFEALRLRFPKAHLACLTFLENRELVEGNPFLDEVILYDKRGGEKGGFGNFRFARRLAEKRFDTVVHLHPTNRMHWVSWLAGIPVRIGYRKKNAWALTHTIEDRKGEGLKHESEYNFDLLKFLNVKPPEKLRTYFPLKERDRVSLEFLLRNLSPSPFALSPRGGEGGGEGSRSYGVLNPSASCPSKVWPAERFARLADRLQEKFGFPVVLT